MESEPSNSQQTSHRDILLLAKQNQKKNLRESAALSLQLTNAIQALIQSNSGTSANGPTVLDKITTIHQLDKEIDRQLNEDISENFEALVADEDKLERLIEKIHRKLGYKEFKLEFLLIESLQRRSELIDQELRILEHTLNFVQRNNR